MSAVLNGRLAPAPVSACGKANGRFGFALTRHSLLLLLAGTLFLLPAFRYHPLLWATLAWDLLLLALAAVDGVRLPSPGTIEAERIWHAAPMLGTRIEVELRLRHGRQSLIFCDLIDDLPRALVPLPLKLSLVCYPVAWSSVRYALCAAERGDHQGGKLFVRYRGSAGLTERWATVDLSQTVRVYPAVAPGEEQSLFLARTRQLDLQLRRHHHRGLGRDFESLRDYQEGDDLRDVCWTAAARRGTLIAKQYQAERAQTVWIMVDAGRLLQTRVGAYSKLDHAAATALAVAQLALFSGAKVGLIAYGSSTQQRIAPGRGSAHLRHMLDSLALVRSESGEADHLRATAELGRMQPRRALVLWLTDLADTAMRPEVIDGAAQMMRRHLVLFVIINQQDVHALMLRPPKDSQEMFKAAAAQEWVERRTTLLSRLRQGGALTLETTGGEMTAAVLNRYLEIKERSLL